MPEAIAVEGGAGPVTGGKRCPACGGSGFDPTGQGRVRCRQCGADLAYDTPWLSYLLLCLAVGAVAAVASALLFPALGIDGRAARLGFVGGLTGAVAAVAWRRLRRLRKA